MSLNLFAKDVLSIAKRAKKFGSNKAFIGSIWRLGGNSSFRELSRGKFNEMLIKAHKQGLLHLSRADLVSAMDKYDVNSSSIKHMNTEYHFVVF